MPRYLALLGSILLIGSLSSCSPNFYGASVDAANDGFKGPSYRGYDTKELLALNIFANWTSGVGKYPDVGSRLPTYPPFYHDPALLTASVGDIPGPISPPAQNSFLSHISFMYGPQLIGKGGKYTDRFGTTTSRRTYLEAIGYALYNYELPNSKGRVFGGLGPFLGMGLWGTINYEDRTGTESIGAFDKNAGGYSRLDGGLAFTAGYELPQGLRLSIAHEMGLINIDPVPGGSDDKLYTRSWSLNVAIPAKKIVALVKKK